jgi:hypothetical protein
MKEPDHRQCAGKIPYRDALSAKIALARAGRAGQLGPDDRMRVYQCAVCGSWHMGHSVGGRPWYEIWQ